MATGAVTSEALGKSIGLCQQAIESLSRASQKLQDRYTAAGAGWKDSKYAQLGGVVSDCRTALGEPVDQLNSCINTLQELLGRVGDYESVSF